VDNKNNTDSEDTLEAQYNSVKKHVWSSARPIDSALDVVYQLLQEVRRQRTVMRAAYVEIEEAHRSPHASALKRCLIGEDSNTIYPNMMSPSAREEFLGELRGKLNVSEPEAEYGSGPSPMLAKIAFESKQSQSDKT